MRRLELAIQIAIAAVATFAWLDTRRQGEASLSFAERERGLGFLEVQTRTLTDCAAPDRVIDPAATACELDEVGDVDGDGVADCWRLQHRLDGHSELAVWLGCRGPAARLVVSHRGMTRLDVPPPLASARWERWIAERIVGERGVTCAGTAIAGCPAPTAAWRWQLASLSHGDADPGAHGVAQVAWGAIDSSAVVPAALVIPQGPSGPQILVDAAIRGEARAVDCNDIHVVAAASGFGAYDAERSQFRWLFRDPDVGDLTVSSIECRAGVVIASTSTALVAVDLETGGWLVDPGAHTRDGWGSEDLRWQRRDGTVIELNDLRAWLRRTRDARDPLSLEAVRRPELLFDPHAEAAARMPLEGALPPLFAASEVSFDARADLDGTVVCGSWTISYSRNAILAERRGAARWLMVEPQDSPHTLGTPACDGDVVFVDHYGAHETFDPLVISFELARARRWQSVRPFR